MEKEVYKVKTTCKNCYWAGTQEIEKGCSVEVLSSRECPICGCQDLYSLGISKEMPLSNLTWNKS